VLGTGTGLEEAWWEVSLGGRAGREEGRRGEGIG